MTSPPRLGPQDPVSPSGQRLLVELCQFVFLLRLLALGWIAFAGDVADDWRVLAVMAVSTSISLVGTFTLHRALRTVAAHPLIVGGDIAICALGIWASSVDVRFVLLGVTAALLIGLLHRGLIAASLALLLVLSSAVAVVLVPGASVEEATRWLEQIAAMFVFASLGAAVVRVRILALAAEVLESGQARAQAEERARMAREMHDGVVKTLHGIALSAQGLARSADASAKLRGQLDRFAEAAAFGVRQAREALVELRVEQDDRPLSVVAKDIVHRWGERARVKTEVAVSGGVDVTGAARAEGLACLRQALDNVAEHAGAGCVRMTMISDARACVLTVVDDGRGFEPRRLRAAAQRGHYGVRGMEERMRKVGGDLTISSVVGAGTTVRIEMPQAGHAGQRRTSGWGSRGGTVR